MLGWAIGNFGGADRRLRNYCVVGAILPDIDAIPYIFGAKYYEHFHHTFGHNVFLGALFTFWVGWKCGTARAWTLAALSFSSHLLTDAHFSGWNLYLFWPFSRKGYLFPNAVDLSHPSNIQAMYAGFALTVLLAFLYRRTPMDIFSPKLDQLFISFFRRKNNRCHACHRRSNQLCAVCGQPVCFRHGLVGPNWETLCASCARESRKAPPD